MSDWLEIHALADEQLSAEEKARVQERLAGCEQSRRELEAIRSIKGALGSRKDAVSCEATWARCRRRLEEVEKVGRIESFVGRYSWGICSMFLVFIAGAAMFNRMLGKAKVGASDVPNMAANLAPYLFAPKSQARSDVAEFEDRAVGRAPVRVPSATTQGVVIVRGGSLMIDGRHYVRVDMLDSGQPVTLYAVEGANVSGVDPVPGREDLSQGVINDRNCVAWVDGDYSVMLVGKESVPELCELADVVSP